MIIIKIIFRKAGERGIWGGGGSDLRQMRSWRRLGVSAFRRRPWSSGEKVDNKKIVSWDLGPQALWRGRRGGIFVDKKHWRHLWGRSQLRESVLNLALFFPLIYQNFHSFYL